MLGQLYFCHVGGFHLVQHAKCSVVWGLCMILGMQNNIRLFKNCVIWSNFEWNNGLFDIWICLSIYAPLHVKGAINCCLPPTMSWVVYFARVGLINATCSQSLNSSKGFRLSGATCHRDRSTNLWKTSQSDWRLELERAMDTSNIHSDNGILAFDH